MTPETEKLIRDVRTYCDLVGIKPSTLTTRALNDGGFVRRLEAGGQCLPRTEARVRAYMRQNPAPVADLDRIAS